MRARFTKMSPGVTLINDADESTCYLIEGDRSAILFDTVNGRENLHDVVRRLTDKHLHVINSHGHCDHTHGNIFFGKAYLNKADKALCEEHFKMPDIVEYMQKTGLRPCKTVDIEPGDKFDLGNRELEVFLVPGHTAGSICLLDRSSRTLFTGDAINPYLWMQLEESTDISTLIASLKALAPIRSEFDNMLGGHAQGYAPATMIDDVIACAQDLLDGNTAGDADYEWMGNTSKIHEFAGTRIVYEPAKVK